MKLLYLIYKSCSKHFIKEFFLVLQICVFVVFLTASITPFINYYQISRSTLDLLPKRALYYTTPFGGSAEDGNNYFEQFETEEVAEICHAYKVYGSVNENPATIILYNKDMFDCIDYELANGEWGYNENGVFVNDLRNGSIGTGLKIDFTIGKQDISVSRQIIGKIKSDEVVFNIVNGGSRPDIRSVGIDYVYQRHVNPYIPSTIVILPFDFNSAGVENIMDGAILIAADEENYDHLLATSEETLVGSVWSINDVRRHSFLRMIDAYNIDFLIGVLILLSAIFSIGGYSFLRVVQLQRQGHIYKICGCRKKTYFFIVLAGNVIITAVGIVIALQINRFVVLSEGYAPMYSNIIVGLLALVFMVMPLLALLHREKSSGVMSSEEK